MCFKIFENPSHGIIISRMFLFILVMEQERHALQRFRALVGATLELLSLWNILLEHELNAIFKLLNPNTQSALINYPLEAIVRSRTEVMNKH